MQTTETTNIYSVQIHSLVQCFCFLLRDELQDSLGRQVDGMGTRLGDIPAGIDNACSVGGMSIACADVILEPGGNVDVQLV